MALNMHVFVFGDQTYDFVSDLRSLLSCRDKPILQAFLEQSHYVLRAQMNLVLPKDERKASRTSGLPHMLQKYSDGILSPAFQTALHCITQLGCFISYLEEPGRAYPAPEQTYLVGLCTGALATAAISSSNSLSELLPAAVHTVQVAFRLGMCVVDMRDRIEVPEIGLSQEWSTVFLGLDEDSAATILDGLFASKKIPESSRPWISAMAGKATTISAAPSIMRNLTSESSPLFKYKHRRIPIFVPSHSACLFSQKHKDEILETTSVANWMGFVSRIPVISGANGRVAWAGGFVSLLDRAVSECLTEPIRWDKVVQHFPDTLRTRGVESIIVTPVASELGQSMSRALQECGPVHVESINKLHSDFPRPTPVGRSKLAIVGMSGRFPESPNLEAFWDLLHQGLDVCKEVPRKRWDVATHVDPTGKAHNKGATPWGCWLDFAGQFDPRFFSISPKEAPQMDPAQRMALMSTFEAMESGGIVPDSTASTQRDRVGVFHGVTSNDWMETNTAQDIDTYFITGGNRGFIPGRINFCFEFCGPSFTNDTACSSSLAAIHLACNSLWRGDCDTAIAGGTNMIFTPDGHTGLDKGFFLSRTGNCKAFADNADGYCRAEGVGTVFIKRLDDALADNDPILAVILDAKTNHSAMSDSMTRPHVGAQIDNMTAVLNSSGIDPKQISYVEMHGTGTQVGDAVEMESVLSVFARDENFRDSEHSLYLGSAKANIGHGEGVSGITSLVKLLLMMKHDTIPPHCGIKPGEKINHNFPDLNARNVRIAFTPQVWKRGTEPRRALINNFSAAGGNTAILLEDAPIRPSVSVSDPRTTHVVTVSGHVVPSLKKNLQMLVDHVKHPDVQKLPLAQLSWTTTARRVHHLFRVSVKGSSLTEIKEKLEQAIARGDGTTRAKVKPSILFAFTGQGSQYMGMGKQLCDTYPRFKADLTHMDQLCQSLNLPSFLHTITSEVGDIDQLSPIVVQLAITSLEMALARLAKHFGVVPQAVVGHSLGEYAALNTAGILSISDTLYLVGRRAELLQQHCERNSHSMLAVKASVSQLTDALIGEHYEIACINGPQDVVIGGTNDHIETAKLLLLKNGDKCTSLKVPFAFHSTQVGVILQSFEAIAAGVTFRKPTLPVLCPLTGEIITDEGVIGPKYLSRHCRETVNMVAALKHAEKAGLINDKTLTVELGPHPVVSGMIKATLGSAVPTLPVLQRGGNVWQNLATLLGIIYSSGYDVNWIEYHAPFESAHRVVELPSYAWDLKEYYIPYEGDWCLHRHALECSCADPDGPVNHTGKSIGFKPISHSHGTRIANNVEGKTKSPEQQTIAQPETSTVHRVVEERIEALGATLIVETDVSRPDVSGVAQGHAVNNIPLCTPSVYADIALVLGKYLMQRLRPGQTGMVDVGDLVIDKALIPHGLGSQLLRTKMTVKWPAKAAGSAKEAPCEFYSVDSNGKTTAKHSWCTVHFLDRSKMLKELEVQVPAFKDKIDRLRKGIKTGQFVKYNRTSGYKLMSNVAHFHPDYKLLDNLILDETTLEACSTINISTITSKGEFAAHPAYVDAITQVGGFALNAKDSTNLDDEVFVNHGWESFQVYEDAQVNKNYDVYVQMKAHKADLYHGDTIVLDGSKVVAFFKGVSLRNVPRKALRMVLQQNLDKANRAAGKPRTTQAAGSSPAAKTTSPGKPSQSIPAETGPVGVKMQASLPDSNVACAPSGKSKPAKDFAVIPSKSMSKKAHDALVIVAEESGIAIEELTDDVAFADIGVDSLLSMVISSRLREELDLDLDPDFSIFVDLPTVKALKESFGGLTSIDNAEDRVPSLTAEETPVNHQVEARAEHRSVPPASDAVKSSNDALEPSHSHPPTASLFTEDMLQERVRSPTIMSALEIISEESGIVVSDLTDDCNFADIGVDSLMSMVISSRLREELDLDLDTDFSLFVDLPTVKALRQFLTSCGGSSDSSNISEDYDFASTATTPPATDEVEVSLENQQKIKVDHCRPATSVIIQGKPKTTKKTIFLLPDGGGSASSYVAIPRIGDDVAVVGLNCPYLRDPENMQCTHTALIASFCNEIRRRQPTGPYYLGGWSSGGAFAYVCAEALTDAGEQIAGMVIIDAPVPQAMEQLPTSFYEYCNSIGLFGHDEPPAYLIPHFAATVDVMMPYKVKPLNAQRMPKVGILWACDTVMDEKDAPKMKGMHFMIQKRVDFGPDGWETVLPGAEFIIDKVYGGNHFTLMAKDHIHQVSDLIARVLE